MDKILDEVREILKQVAISQANNEKDMQLAKERQDRTEVQIAETNAQLAKTDAKLKETAQILSNIGINIGHTAEEFFYYSLQDNPKLGNIVFDYVSPNISNMHKGLQDEFDIVMYNGDSIALIEIKHKVHPSDIETLKTNKVNNFRYLFPLYKDYKIYLGIGGLSVPKDIENKAQKEGIAVLRQKGEIAQIQADSLKAY
ncbi:MAG: hypothetical protein NW207_07380 [Cytophagales bacterium]|nr:hypothetical protein [Cytophagales bacterium]